MHQALRRLFHAAIFFLLIVPSPLHANLREQLVEHINKTKSSIDLVVYDIRSDDIADALILAKRRAVQVRIIIDNVHSEKPTQQEQALEDDGILIKHVVGASRDQLHEKFIIFDGSIASTPSYNRSAKSLSGGAANNSFTDDKTLIGQLKSQFDSVWQNSEVSEP